METVMTHFPLIERARSRIGLSTYRKLATVGEAPEIFNCFSFIQWLWQPVVLPDHLLVWECAHPVLSSDMQPLDLVFVARRRRTYYTDDFGHVGLFTDIDTVIHATAWQKGVVEEPLSSFLSRDCLGIRRIRMPSS